MKDTVGLDTRVTLTGPDARIVVDLEGIRLHSVYHEDIRTKPGVTTIRPITPRWTVAGMQARAPGPGHRFDGRRSRSGQPARVRAGDGRHHPGDPRCPRRAATSRSSSRSSRRPSTPPATVSAPCRSRRRPSHASSQLRGPDGAPRAGAVIGDAGDEHDRRPRRGERRPRSGRRPAGACSRRDPTPSRPPRRRRPEQVAAASAWVGRSCSRRSAGPASCWRSPATSRHTSRRAAARGSTRRRSSRSSSSSRRHRSSARARRSRCRRSRMPSTGSWSWRSSSASAGRDIPLERARDHIAGYSVINDISARSMQWGVEGREPGGFDDFFDWLNGKWGDGFAAWGPYITTTDSVSPDPNDLEMTLKVNDKVVAARLDRRHDLQPRGDHRLRVAVHDARARRRHRRRDARRDRRCRRASTSRRAT